MGLKDIWQKLISFKNSVLRHTDWTRKNKKIIDGFHDTARRSMEAAARAPLEDAKEPDADIKPPSNPAQKKDAIPDKAAKKETEIPPRLTAILKKAQENTIDAALSQQSRIKDLYGAEAFQNTAKRLFKDPRISHVLASGSEQLKQDIRFVDDKKIDAAGQPLQDIEPLQQAMYAVLSAALINALDPQNELKPALRRIANLHGNLRNQGVFLNERIIEGFEAAINEHSEGLKNPPSNIVAFKKPESSKPSDPGGMK